MALSHNPVVRRAQIANGLRAEGYSQQRINSILDFIESDDDLDEADADDECAPDSWSRQLQSTRACAQTKL